MYYLKHFIFPKTGTLFKESNLEANIFLHCNILPSQQPTVVFTSQSAELYGVYSIVLSISLMFYVLGMYKVNLTFTKYFYNLNWI